MRLLLSVSAGWFLVGCLRSEPFPPPDPPTPNNGWTDPQGNPIGGCEGACGSLTCARDGGCYPADRIHAVHASWTIDGGPANGASCTTADLFIQFTGSDFQELGFAPVPCTAGRFTVDKLPLDYTTVNLSSDVSSATATIDPVTGDALLDL